MKKLMFGLAIAAVGSAFAVESSNIVGYQKITIPTGYSLFSVTFKDVGGSEYDIQDIKVLTVDGADYTTNNRVRMQKITAVGDYGTAYNYRLSKGGWCQSSTYIGTGVVTFGDGEGVALYNGDSSPLLLQVSGSVNLTPVSTAIPASSYKIIGNMTPVAVDIQSVIPYIGDTICSANNRVRIQKVTTIGDYGTAYNWRQSKGGWCQGSTYIGTGVLTLNPGEAVAVLNGESSAVTLKFPSPISE